MISGKYSLDINKLAVSLLPYCLRRSVFLSILKSVVASLAVTNSSFATYRNEKTYRMSHNSQVCYLRAALNDTYSPQKREVTISDSDTEYQAVRLYKRTLDKPLIVSRRSKKKAVDIFGRENGNTKFVSFKVTIPGLLDVTGNRFIRSFIDSYKLAGTRYKLVFKGTEIIQRVQ